MGNAQQTNKPQTSPANSGTLSVNPELQKQLENEVAAAEALQTNASIAPPSSFTPESTPTPIQNVLQNMVPPPQAPVEFFRSPSVALTADAMRTKQILDTFPKVRMALPLYIGEKAGVSTDTASINGYTYTVKKGIMVDLPEPIAQLFMEHYNIQQGETAFGASKRIDRDEAHENALN